MNVVRKFFERLSSLTLAVEALQERGLQYWRERVFSYTLSAMLLLGLIALVPSVWLSLISGFYLLAVVDVAAYLLVVGLLVYRHRISYNLRAAILLVIGLAVGIIVFYITGDEGGGMFWMFMVPPLASVLLGLQAGLFFFILNFVFIMITAFLVVLESPLMPRLTEFSFEGWAVYAINFMVTNGLVTFPLGALLNGLFQSTEHEKKVVEDYRLLFAANPLPMWVYDSETLRFLAVNDAAIEHYGYSRSEFLAMTIKEIRPVGSVPDLERNLEKIHETLRQVSGPWTHRKKDGLLLEVEVFSNSLEFDNRAARLVLASDITERLAAEKKLQQSDQILQRVKSVVLVMDSAGEVVYVSPSVEEMLGYKVEELMGNGWWQLTRESQLQAEAEKSALKYIADGSLSLSPHPYERAIRTRKGEVRWIEWQDALGPNRTVIGVGRDITDKKAVERENRQKIAQLEAVRDVSISLRSALSLEEMLPLLLDSTLKVLNLTSGSIWLYDKSTDLVNLAISRGYVDADGNESKALPEKPGQGLAGSVFASGEIHISKEHRSNPRISEAVRERIPPGLGGVAAPIRVGEEVIGVFEVNTNLPREITSSEVSLLITLVEIAGNAIQRSKLHQKTEQQLEQFKVLNEIDQIILSSFDLQFNLKMLLGTVVEQLEVDAANILLYDAVTQTLTALQGVGFRTASFAGRQVQLGEGNAGKAVSERKTIHIEHLDKQTDNPRLARALSGEGFVSYYGVPLIAKGEVRGVLELFHRTPLVFQEDWLSLVNALAGRAAIAIDTLKVFENLDRTNKELVLSYDAAIEGWSQALDLRDKETEGHSQRVTALAVELARALGVHGKPIVHFSRGALLHDIGKMGIPDSILLKPGKLTDEEWVIMRKHPTFARDMLENISFLQEAIDIPYGHHEKWDGSGYPRGLVGEQIPLAARIFAVVDVYDALTSDRPYRKAWTKKKTIAYIREQSGTHFDPRIVEAFLKLDLPE